MLVPLGQSRMFVAKARSVAGCAVPELMVRVGKGHGWPEMADEDCMDKLRLLCTKNKLRLLHVKNTL